MEERGGVSSWFSKVSGLSGLSSYLSQLIRPTEPSVQLKNSKTCSCSKTSSAVDDDLCEVGGVEVMKPFTDDAPCTARSPRGVEGSKYQGTPYRCSYADERQTSHRLSSTPFLSTFDTEEHTTDHIRASGTPKSPKTKDIGKILSSRQQSTPAITKTRVSVIKSPSCGNGQTRSSPYVKIGGNDGLTDSEDEEMDGVDDESSGRQSSSSVELVGQFKSPGMSQFRFHPTVTSTAERKQWKSISRKENKFSFKSKKSNSKNFPFPRQSCRSLVSKEPLRGTSVINSTLHKGRRFGSIMNSTFNRGVVRDCINKMGLSEAYFSSAIDCYKPVDKQHYRELVKQIAALGNNFCGNSSTSSFSTSSVASVPVAKTIMGSEWSRKKALEIEQQEMEQKRRENQDISLWTADQEKITAGTSVSNVSSGGRSTTSIQETTDGNVTQKKPFDTEDDEIMITKENVRKVVRLNSFEHHPKFRALHKFTEGWLHDVKNRRLEREAELQRPLRESQETLKMGLERRMKTPSVEDIVSRRFQMLDMRHPSARVELEEEDVLVELTPQMEQIISNALRKNPPGEVLTEKFNIQITRRDIATLDGLNWLNDEVVNFYMNLIMERSKNDNFCSVYAFNTFFYPKLVKIGFSGVKRWTKKVDIFSYDLLLVPVHLGMHWCLATINTKDKVITYYDSMLGDNTQCLHELRKYLADEMGDKKKTSLDLTGWKFETPKDIPQQMNGSDCGMFACKFSEYLSRRKPITFTQDHMPYFRRRMVYEIVTNKLL
ncbi:Ulp1 protease family C-terminal catalytic domain [Trinorchestia longiramus]|nr:Ulp1 protease family C-terminal catalytic domain [Trinorchestia longiramus]